MDFAAVSAGAAIITLFGAMVTWIARLGARLAQADAKADAAAEKASNAALISAALRVEIDRLENELVSHRVSVAKEYVSNTTIATLEEKLIKAIDRLGDRLDSLFQARQKNGNT